jgi:hypothetical protein
MIVAFHFRADAEVYSSVWVFSIKERIFRRLNETDAHAHAVIATGDLLIPHDLGTEGKEAVLQALIGYDPRKWRTIHSDEFADVLFSTRIYVVAIEGLGTALQDALDAELRRDDAYLGAIEIDPANRIHWVLYRQKLVTRYRYVDGEVRLFYRKFEADAGADAKDTGTADELKRRGFRVAFEDSGLRETIFDRYQSFEHSQRSAALDGYLQQHLGRMANEVLMRFRAADPRQMESLHAAFRTFERIETAEDIAQVATSCRRFLEGLADMLYPPRDGSAGSRKVGAAEYRNRLWAYVDENIHGAGKNLALAQLDDLGHRIDALDRLSNKGVHDRISAMEARRLIVGLVVVAYDLLSLTPPPLSARNEPHGEAADDIVRNMISWHRERGKAEPE